MGRNPIKVAKTPLVRGFRWRVEFEVYKATWACCGSTATGCVATNEVRVVEVTPGKADLVPGTFTYEVQTITVSALSDITETETFTLSFEGRTTGGIQFKASAEQMSTALEASIRSTRCR